VRDSSFCGTPVTRYWGVARASIEEQAVRTLVGLESIDSLLNACDVGIDVHFAPIAFY
jgi:cystathionine beta-lyase/cystathionine gamma-synthase